MKFVKQRASDCEMELKVEEGDTKWNRKQIYLWEREELHFPAEAYCGSYEIFPFSSLPLEDHSIGKRI